MVGKIQIYFNRSLLDLFQGNLLIKWALSTVRVRLDLLSRSVRRTCTPVHCSVTFFFDLKIKDYKRKSSPYMVSIRK